MKDDKLEQQFKEYFNGVETPKNITGDAKKHVPEKRSALPRFVKFASVAASFVIVFAATLAVILRGNFPSGPVPDETDTPFTYYDAAELVRRDENAYSAAETHSSLKFIQKLAVGNAAVGDCAAYYDGENLTLYEASVSLINGLYRHDTRVYVEFTQPRLVYSEVGDFYDGEKFSRGGAEYYITQDFADNGEPEYKLCILNGGVKYYFRILSADRAACEKYINMILK